MWIFTYVRLNMFEIVIIGLIGVACYMKWISPTNSILALLFIYWMPRTLLVPVLSYTHPKLLTHVPCSGNIIITIDDVPYGPSFENILNTLDRFNVKAVFFVISDQVNNTNKEGLIRAIRAGHQLGNHGKTNSAHILKSVNSLSDEIESCDITIKDLYKQANVQLPTKMVYRPGCGAFTQNMINLAESYNYTTTLGSIYPNDPAVRSSIINYYYIKAKLAISHSYSNIIILHDRPWTIPLLEKLLPDIVDTFRIVTFDES